MKLSINFHQPTELLELLGQPPSHDLSNSFTYSNKTVIDKTAAMNGNDVLQLASCADMVKSGQNRS